MPHGALGAIDTGTAQVVQVRTGEVRQPLKTPLAKDFELPPHHRAGGRATPLISDLVNLGQQPDIGRRADPLEGSPTVALTAVGDLPHVPVLGNEPGHLGAGQSRCLGQVLAYRTLVRPPEPVMADANQRTADELAGAVPVLWMIVDGLIAIQEGPDLVDGAEAFGL